MDLTITRFIASAFVLVSTAAFATEFDVSPNGDDSNPGTQAKPFATLERVRDAIRGLKQAWPLKEPVTVWMHGGTYPLSKEIRFGPEDSGTAACPITYTAAGMEPVELNGGRRIPGWKKHSDELRVADLPEAARGAWRFRQLYVNGRQRVRARPPNEGYFRVAGCPEGTPKISITVRNNIFTLGKLEQASRSRTEPHKSVLFENNFTLRPGSPAFALGFQPIDRTQVGPRIKTAPPAGMNAASSP